MPGLDVGVHPTACLMCAVCPLLWRGEGRGGWQQGCEGDCLGQFSAEVNHEWYYTSPAMICLHVLRNTTL
jgi:hypothetical protein